MESPSPACTALRDATIASSRASAVILGAAGVLVRDCACAGVVWNDNNAKTINSDDTDESAEDGDDNG